MNLCQDGYWGLHIPIPTPSLSHLRIRKSGCRPVVVKATTSLEVLWEIPITTASELISSLQSPCCLPVSGAGAQTCHTNVCLSIMALVLLSINSLWPDNHPQCPLEPESKTFQWVMSMCKFPAHLGKGWEGCIVGLCNYSMLLCKKALSCCTKWLYPCTFP